MLLFLIFNVYNIIQLGNEKLQRGKLYPCLILVNMSLSPGHAPQISYYINKNTSNLRKRMYYIKLDTTVVLKQQNTTYYIISINYKYNDFEKLKF